jgi:hypothetical protein
MARFPMDLDRISVGEKVEIIESKTENSITVEGVFPVGTKLRFSTDSNLLRYLSTFELVGVLGISDLAQTIQRVTQADIDTKVRYISSRPPTPPNIALTLPAGFFAPVGFNPLLPDQEPPGATFPWIEAVIPHKKNQPFPDGEGVQILKAPDSLRGAHYDDAYGKFRSVTNSVNAYIGFEQTLVSPKNEKWTVFLTDLKDRGRSNTDPTLPEEEWEIVNYQKKAYMFALSVDKLQFYLPKIEQFVNNAFAAASIYDHPLISSFQKNLVLFFLRMHIGNDDYPDYVIQWFSDFITFVGIGDPNNPERRQLLQYGAANSPRIFDYFEQRNIKAVTENDVSTLTYWWSQAGLSAQALVFECVHNIVAFSQFTHVLFQTVYATLPVAESAALEDGKVPSFPNLGHNQTLVGIPFPNFFTRYQAANTSEEKLDVVREAYRMLSPNALSFSLLNPGNPGADPVPVIKPRHQHQQIMIASTAATYPPPPQEPPLTPQQLQGLAAVKYFTYNLGEVETIYKDYQANLDGLDGIPVVTDVLQASVTAPYDRETVIDNSTAEVRKLTPIFPRPIYAPFGLGYRRCAGEMFSYLVTQYIFEKFSTAEFELRGKWNEGVLISVAPFKQVRDNLYIKQTQ